MSTIKVNIADATIADLQTKLGLNRSVAKVITEQKPCNMEEFLQIEGVVWDDIKSKEPNAELEFISTNEFMSTDSKPALPNQASESIMGEFEKFTQQFQSVMQGEFNKFAQQMSGRMEIIQSEFSVNKHDMNDSKSEIKEEMQHFQLAVESVNKKGIKVENINEINPQNSELGTSNGKDSYQSEHESVNGKNLQHSDSEVLSCKESVSSKPVHNDYKKDENDSQCKHAKTKTDHFAEYHQVYESKIVDGVYRPTNTTNSDPESTGQGHSAPSSLMQNGINLAEEHNRNGVIVKDGVVDTRPNPTLVAKNAQIKQQPTSYSREGIVETVETDFNVWNKKLAYLPKFDGTNWQAFISVLEHNISRHNLTNSLQLDLLESKLSGQAFQAYGQAHTSMDTYAELKKFLQLRFGTRITPQNCRDDLCHIKQCTDESLTEFASRVKLIAYGRDPGKSNPHRSTVEVNTFLQGCRDHALAKRVIQNTHPSIDSALNDMKKIVQNAHIFKSSNLEKTRVVRNLNNPEATEDTDRTQVARVWENKNSKVQENSSMGGMSLVLREIMKNLDQKDDPIMFDHLWGDAEKIDEPPIMFDHLWGDAEKIDEPPIMFDHLWGDAEKIDEPPIRFDHLWGDAEKIYKPPIMFDHLWGDAEKIDKPPIMFDHLWGDAEKIPITLTYDKNQDVQLALSAKHVYTAPGGEANLSTVPNKNESHLFELPAHLTELSQTNTIVNVKEESYFGTRKTSKSDFKIEWGTALSAMPKTIEGPQHIRSDLERSPENVTAVLKRTHLLNVTEVNTFSDYVNVHSNNGEKYAEVAAPLCALTGKKNSEAIVWEPKQWEQLSRPPDKGDCYQPGNDLGCNYCTRMSKLWEQLSRPPDKCVGHQTGNDLGCNHYTRLSKLWEQLSRPPDRCDCYLVGNNLSKLPCGGCNYCIHMNKQWEQLTRPPDECNCYQAGKDPSKLPCGGCKYCTRMSKQWEQFPLDVDDVLPSTVFDPLKIINADIRTVNVEDAKESTLHTPAPNWCSTSLVSDIRDKQREDPDLILAVNWVFNETVPTQAELAMSSTVTRFYWSNRNLLSEKNGVIYYRWIQDTSSRDLIIVPRALKEVVLSGCHDEITAGHFSSRKTLNCSTQKKANLLAWTSSIGDSRNIAPPWIGPFLVVQIFSGATYKVKGEQCSCVLHYNILMPSGERPYDPIMFDHLGEDVKKVSDPSPHYTETILGVPNFKGSPKSSEGSNSATDVVANEKIHVATDLMGSEQVNEAINLVPLQDPITSHSGRPRKLPRHLNDYNL